MLSIVTILCLVVVHVEDLQGAEPCRIRNTIALCHDGLCDPKLNDYPGLIGVVVTGVVPVHLNCLPPWVKVSI